LLPERELSRSDLRCAKDLPQLQNADKEKVSLNHLSADQYPAGQESRNTQFLLAVTENRCRQLSSDSSIPTPPLQAPAGAVLHHMAGLGNYNETQEHTWAARKQNVIHIQ